MTPVSCSTDFGSKGPKTDLVQPSVSHTTLPLDPRATVVSSIWRVPKATDVAMPKPYRHFARQQASDADNSWSFSGTFSGQQCHTSWELYANGGATVTRQVGIPRLALTPRARWWESEGLCEKSDPVPIGIATRVKDTGTASAIQLAGNSLLPIGTLRAIVRPLEAVKDLKIQYSEQTASAGCGNANR
jgi:hypothetical protein